METTYPTTSNWLLAALSDDARAALLERALRIRIRLGERVALPYQPIDNAYFPESGCVSVAAKLGEGQTVEMAAVGWEGFFNPGFLFDATYSAGESTVQIDGESWILSRRAFHEWVATFPDAERLLRRYANAWMNQIGLHGACNAVHSVDERLVRWILMSHDRTQDNAVPLTHEFLSIMLGVRRASVSVAAASLRDAGMIDYTRGRIFVIDRARLERASCSCYHSVRENYDKIGVPRLIDHSASALRAG